MSRLHLFDQNKQIDTGKILFHNQKGIFQKGCAEFRDSETHELLYEKEIPNKVTVAGSAFTACKHWNIKPAVYTPSYNEVLSLQNSFNEPYTKDGIRPEESIFLFCVGVGGAEQQSLVYDVDPTKWIQPEELVPFRYQLNTNDIPTYLKDKYYGRKIVGDRILYYFKAFESPVVFKQQYTDGTPIDENIYTINRTEPVESYAEILLKITKEDCRDFFLATTGIDDAKVNTISLCTAWKKEIDGETWYQDIRPLTKLNFPTELLVDTTKGIDIIYHIYY